MPYKRKHPVPEKEMEFGRYKGHHTICETLRETYHMVTNEEVKLKLRLAMAMAKAMNQKLQDYKHFFEWVERLQKEKEAQ